MKNSELRGFEKVIEKAGDRGRSERLPDGKDALAPPRKSTAKINGKEDGRPANWGGPSSLQDLAPCCTASCKASCTAAQRASCSAAQRASCTARCIATRRARICGAAPLIPPAAQSRAARLRAPARAPRSTEGRARPRAPPCSAAAPARRLGLAVATLRQTTLPAR